jgi:tryptophanyl-tRNA synthetase
LRPTTSRTPDRFAGERNDCRASVPDCYLWTVHLFGRPGIYVGPDSVMNQEVPLTTNVSNPPAFSGKGSRGGFGDVSLKRRLKDVLQQLLAPVRERRAAVAMISLMRAKERPGEGNNQSTLDEVRDGLGLFSLWASALSCS